MSKQSDDDDEIPLKTSWVRGWRVCDSFRGLELTNTGRFNAVYCPF